MKLTVLGAAGEVTGSCYLIQTEHAKFLVDLGLFQGGSFAERKNYDKLAFDPKEISAVFITHGHLDHIGRLPLLAKRGRFNGKIFMVEPTFDISKLILADAAKIIKGEARRDGHQPLYRKTEVNELLSRVTAVKYHQKVNIAGAEVTFYDAGHILGSSFIRIKADGTSVVFSGDLGNPPSLFHKFTEKIPQTENVVVEATYGHLNHEDPRERYNKLERAIENIIKKRGTLLIPTFALDRTQELLYAMDELVRRKASLCIPIFLDSPLAIRLTDVYERYGSYYNTEAARYIAAGEDIFDFPCLRDVLRAGDSLELDHVPGPKVILAGNGMMSGGRILHHAKKYLEDGNSEVLFIGYQAKGSLGRKLFDGLKNVRIEGRQVKVAAEIKAVGAFSGHADQRALIYWLGGARGIKRIFITHSEEDVRESFAEAIRRTDITSEVIRPSFGQTFEL